MNEISEKKALSVIAILLLHLLPGIPILLIALILANPKWGLGLDFAPAMYASVAFGLIPVQLGIIWFYAKKQEVKFKEVIGFTVKMPFFKTVLWVLPLLIFMVVILIVVRDMERSLWVTIGWMPDWFLFTEVADQTDESLMASIISIFGLLLSCIFGPLTEEIYFRGFLLPRMQKLAKWAPLINAILFSLYHFYSPWENITRIITLIPLAYAVWHNKNIRIGIWAHCLMNFVYGAIMLS